MLRRLSRTRLLGALGATAVSRTGFPLDAAAVEPYTLRLSVNTAVTNLQTIAMLRFAEMVGRRANGRLKIEVYANGQIANMVESVQQLPTGIIDLAVAQTVVVETLIPRLQVLVMPFLFKDLPSAFRVFDGPIGDEFVAQLDAKGIVGLGWGSEGFREIETLAKPVSVPEDMRGLRVRNEGGAVNVATYQTLGAVPVTLDAAEEFTALAQHAVDALEAPLAAFITRKFYTVARYVSMTNHVLSIALIMGSKRKLEALPADLQRLIKTEAKAVVQYWRGLVPSHNAENTRFLKEQGVSFNEVRHAAFRKAMDPVYAAFQPRLGDLLDRVTRAAGAG